MPEISQPTSLAAVGALIGDPVRAAILLHLADGSCRPAGELAHLAGASPQAASAHLAQLVDGGLLAVQREGRHRFFRISSGEVAEMIEGLTDWADCKPRRRLHDPQLCRARLCYDHLAGRLGVALFDRMTAQGWLVLGPDGPGFSPEGLDWCAKHRLDAAAPARSRRPVVRLCLDWTERRPHIGGHFGASFAKLLFEHRYVRREANGRPVAITPRGDAFLRRELAIDLVG